MQAVTPDELMELGSGSSAKTRVCYWRRRVVADTFHWNSPKRYYTPGNKLPDSEYDWLHVDVNIGDFDTDLPKLP